MHAFSKRPSARHLIFKYRASKTQKIFFRAAYKFLNFCRALLTVNISEMADKEKRMKTIEETFKAKKERLENFFRNKIKFKELINGTVFYSVEIFEYNEYIRNSIRVFIKGFLLYLDSLLRIDGHHLGCVEVTGREIISMKYFPILQFEYSPILRLEELVVGTNDFLDQLDHKIYNTHMRDFNLWGVEPFNIIICIERQNISQVDNKKVIKVDKIFKAEECVICLLTKPNVLFCGCGHLCICNECNKIKKNKCMPHL